jgi:hypothetical protein
MSSFWNTVGIIILIIAFVYVLSVAVTTLVKFMKNDDD